MENEVRNARIMRNTMYIVFGMFALALFVVIRINPSLAEEGSLLRGHSAAPEDDRMLGVLGDGSCTLYDGSSIENGTSIPAYTKQVAPYGVSTNTCSSETVVCDNGTLHLRNSYSSNGYGRPICTTEAPQNCTLYDGTSVNHDSGVMVYKQNTVPSGEDCKSYHINGGYNGAEIFCDNGKFKYNESRYEAADIYNYLGFQWLECTPEIALQNCTTSDGETVEDGDTIEAYINNNPEGTSCDNYEEFENQTVYNKQEFVCINGDFYFSGDKVRNSYSSFFDYSDAYNDIYVNCSRGCSVYAPTSDDWHVDESYYISNGSNVTVYPYNTSFGSIDNCVEDALVCDDGILGGSSRYRDSEGEYFGYGVCIHNPSDMCGYSDKWTYDSRNNMNGWVDGGYTIGKTTKGYTKMNGTCEFKDYICGDGGHWYLYKNGVEGIEVPDLYYYDSNCEASDEVEIQSTEADFCTLHDGTVITGDDSHITVYKKNSMPNSLGCDYIGKSPDWEGNSAMVYCKNGKFYTSADTSTYYDDIYEAKGYGWSGCTTVKGESCYLSEDSTEVEDDATITAYTKESVYNEESCSSDTLKCYDGTLEFEDGEEYHVDGNGNYVYPNGYGWYTCHKGCTIDVLDSDGNVTDSVNVPYEETNYDYYMNLNVQYGDYCGDYGSYSCKNEGDTANGYGSCYESYKITIDEEDKYIPYVSDSSRPDWADYNDLEDFRDAYATVKLYTKTEPEDWESCEDVKFEIPTDAGEGTDFGKVYTTCVKGCQYGKDSAYSNNATLADGDFSEEMYAYPDRSCEVKHTLKCNNGVIEGSARTSSEGFGYGYSSCSATSTDEPTPTTPADPTPSTPTPSQPSGGSGGGGGGSSSGKKWSTTTVPEETENKVEEKVEEKTEEKTEEKVEEKIEEKVEETHGAADEEKIIDTVATTSTAATSQSNSTVTTASYTEEFQEAYNFAKTNSITTKSSIQDAKMYTELTRIQMAKMMSQYAMNVLGQTPDISKGTVKFYDVPEKLNKEYDNAVTLAYQLGIMGQNMKNNNFRPKDKVTRAEFATALSRMLYNTADGTGKVKYYEPHIATLYNKGIINNTNPKMVEKRGYVMTMLMRSIDEE